MTIHLWSCCKFQALFEAFPSCCPFFSSFFSTWPSRPKICCHGNPSKAKAAAKEEGFSPSTLVFNDTDRRSVEKSALQPLKPRHRACHHPTEDPRPEPGLLKNLQAAFYVTPPTAAAGLHPALRSSNLKGQPTQKIHTHVQELSVCCV